jgi:UDP-N-acetylglucosamine--N-acetylmuramyl-(pentapeptide) pyrophosphoryl-undecaprenol N-acetylglucosamine transferase
MPKKTKKYFLAGGGSGGPVAPMLALASALKKKLPDYEPMLVGHGDPEARMAKAEGIKVLHITAGKYRRYFSLENILTPLWVLIGFFQSLVLIRRYRPAFIFGTGSFVQVPVMWAGWLLGVPVFVHQQDFIPSLANKLCALCATKITVTFEKSIRDYAQGWTLEHTKNSSKVILTGNPVRKLRELEHSKAIKMLKLDPDYPTLLVFGGGTGANSLNNLVWQSLPALVNIANVIHLTGVGKATLVKHPRYKLLEFSDDMGLFRTPPKRSICRLAAVQLCC